MAQRRMLPDGRRLHLSHGPIDLIVEAFGAPAAVAAAYDRAWAAFPDVLPTLVTELPLLRTPLAEPRPLPRGPVARRMVAACWPHRERFVTPMAAVAGSVADHVLMAMVSGNDLDRAYVNNGGDIALHLAPGQHLDAGLVMRVDAPALDGRTRIDHALPARGIATSGWRGRSFSLGIADSVTVLAADAAAADVAATLIANAVDVDDPVVARVPATQLDPDSDLGDRPVTTAVGRLSPPARRLALDAGATAAEALRRAGLIHAALLALQGKSRGVGAPAPMLGVVGQGAA
jgi:ApbE superfamily uncharacterized protein (UPF0280 family)